MNWDHLAKMWRQAVVLPKSSIRYTKTTVTMEDGQQHIYVEERDHIPEADKPLFRSFIQDCQQMLTDFLENLR